jgi:hypothetical protein
MRGHRHGMGGQPAFASGTFTVLFGLPILRPAGLQWPGNALWVARTHTHWGDRGMIREGLASAELTPQTVLARHGGGRKGGGAIEGHA